MVMMMVMVPGSKESLKMTTAKHVARVTAAEIHSNRSESLQYHHQHSDSTIMMVTMVMVKIVPRDRVFHV